MWGSHPQYYHNHDKAHLSFYFHAATVVCLCCHLHTLLGWEGFSVDMHLHACAEKLFLAAKVVPTDCVCRNAFGRSGGLCCVNNTLKILCTHLTPMQTQQFETQRIYMHVNIRGHKVH